MSKQLQEKSGYNKFKVASGPSMRLTLFTFEIQEEICIIRSLHDLDETHEN